MPGVDMPLEELVRYCPPRTEPDDFDAFWAGTLAETRAHALAPVFEPVDSMLALVDVFDVTFSGFGGDRIKAWLVLPAGATRPIPCVVDYPGYGGGRGLPHDQLLYAAAGYAHLYMDVRGQGSGWRSGDTPDREPDGGHPQHPGFMTRGVLNPATYYYRRLAADAVRAVETARAYPLVDPTRIVAAGGSQGGALALMAVGLVPDLSAALVDVPFLCDIKRAVQISTTDPYREIERFLKIQRDKVDRTFATLSYMDGVNFAARSLVPALFSVGLLDEVCPPSTVYAAYHHYAGPKRIEVYPFNGHEGGDAHHAGVRLRFLRDLFGSAPTA